MLEHQGEYSSQWAAMEAIAPKFGTATETLRNWVRQAERDRGLKPGPTSEERQKIEELERENKELRRANEIYNLRLRYGTTGRAALDGNLRKGEPVGIADKVTGMVTSQPLDCYLNDHLAGASFGSDLAKQICSRGDGTSLEAQFRQVAAEIDEDRQTLLAMMRTFDITRNPLKEAGGWAAEKWSRLKFSGLPGMDPAYGNYMAVEALCLGVLGKRSMWAALETAGYGDGHLEGFDLAELIRRADRQHDMLEAARLEYAKELLASDLSPRARRAGPGAG